MAKDFRRPQRDQVFLLPPDMREWLPKGHLVWLVLDVVARLDLSGFKGRAKLGGVGRAPVDPEMLLALLIYGYAHGQRSSRQIERLCSVDVAFRVICGNEPPDHSVIARFRARNEDAFAQLFTQVLLICAKAGLGKFGTIAIDGTKIAANASKNATRSEASLRREAAEILAEAAQADAEEDALFGAARGDELPTALADPTSRPARIDQALAELEKEQAAEAQSNREGARVEHWQQRAETNQARYDRKLAEATERWDRRTAPERQGRPGGGAPPVPPKVDSRVVTASKELAWAQRMLAKAETKAAAAPRLKRSTRANTTDPQSRLLQSAHGLVQGFNAQLAVTADQLVTAVSVSNASTDYQEFAPMMQAATAAAELIASQTERVDCVIGTVLADAGYFTLDNLTEPGPARLIAPGDRKNLRDSPVLTGEPPEGSDALEQMRHRISTEQGRETYAHRSVTVEPVNGHLKDRIGLRCFSRRGLIAAAAELNLSALTLNILKLHRATPA